MRPDAVTNFVALLHGLVKQCVALLVACLLRENAVVQVLFDLDVSVANSGYMRKPICWTQRTSGDNNTHMY